MKSRREMVEVLAVTQLFLSVFAAHKDATSIYDYLGAYFLSSFGSILVFPFVLRVLYKGVGPSLSIWAFYFSTVGSILFLSFISFAVLIRGALDESALMYFSFFPLHLVLVPTGVVFGFLYYAFKNIRP